MSIKSSCWRMMLAVVLVLVVPMFAFAGGGGRRAGFLGGIFHRSQPQACCQPQAMSGGVQVQFGGYRQPWAPPRYPMTPSGPYVTPRGPFPGPYSPSPYSYQPIGQTVGLAGSGVLPGSVTNSNYAPPTTSKCPGGVCRIGGG
jgi:hypothetical protein